MLYAEDTKGVMEEFLASGITSQELRLLFHDGMPGHSTGTFVDTNVNEDLIRAIR